MLWKADAGEGLERLSMGLLALSVLDWRSPVIC